MKNKTIRLAVIIFICSVLCVEGSIAQSVNIKSASKIHKMGGYVITVNYETHDKWTDSVLIKAHCKFDDGEFTFLSSTMNNLEKGWHKAAIYIADIMKKRYGSLRSYRIELYYAGVLADTRNSN